MRKKSVDIVHVSSSDQEEKPAGYAERLATEVKRAVNAGQTFMEMNFSGVNARAPMDSLTAMTDDIYHNGVLNSCNHLRAACVGRLGFLTAPNPFSSDINEQEKTELEKWIRKTFSPSFSTVMYRRNKDYFDFGLGALLIDHNLKRIKKDGIDVGFEISKIRHVPRLRIAPLYPRKITIAGEMQDDPMDLLYPRWIIKITETKNIYGKTFGDPRNINRGTGEPSAESLGELNGPSILYKVQYHPNDEICGYPDWKTEQLSLEISWLIQCYEWGHFTNNAIPNLFVIVPQSKTDQGKSLGQTIKEWFREILGRREETYGIDHRGVMAIEIPREMMKDRSTIPMLIQEIKGPAPDIFLEMLRHKGQRLGIATHTPPSLIHADAGALGSGKDKEADLTRFNELEIIPEQETEEVECLDAIIYQGTPFTSWVIRLKRIDTSDPLKVAQVARTWSQVWFAQARDLRQKSGLGSVMADSEEIAKKFGNIVLMPFNQTPITLEQLVELSEQATVMEETGEKPQSNDDKQQQASKFLEYLKANYRMTARQFVEHGLPVIQRFIEEKRNER